MASDAPTSLVDEVYASVRDAILAGEYCAGSRLTAAGIAQRHRISAIPVREAFRRLETERLLSVEPNRGATVTHVSLADLRDVYATREALECDALRRGFAAITADVVDALAADVEAMRDLGHAGRIDAAYGRHEQFHFGLYETAGSPWTTHLIRQLWGAAERYLRQTPRLVDDADAFAVEHAQILAAVRTGDPDAAVAELRRHIRRSGALVTQGWRPDRIRSADGNRRVQQRLAGSGRHGLPDG